MGSSIFLSYPKPFLKKQEEFVERVTQYLQVRIRMSKGLNFPCRPISPILHHNIYQRCAASPQDIVAQS